MQTDIPDRRVLARDSIAGDSSLASRFALFGKPLRGQVLGSATSTTSGTTGDSQDSSLVRPAMGELFSKGDGCPGAILMGDGRARMPVFAQR